MRTLNIEEIQSIAGGVSFFEAMLDVTIISICANIGASLAFIKPLMDFSTQSGYSLNRVILAEGIFLGTGIGVAVSQVLKASTKALTN